MSAVQIEERATPPQALCNHCHNRFVEPRLLPCLHTFCTLCIEEQASKSNPFFCLSCNYEVKHTGKKNWVLSLPIDNPAKTLVEILNLEEGEAIHCEICDGDEKAAWRCNDCPHYMCESCMRAHRRMKSSQNHAILSLEEIREKGITALQGGNEELFCDEHPKEIVRLFCQNCTKLICRDCVLVSHRDHKYDFVEKVTEQRRSEIEKGLSEAKKKLQTIEHHLKTGREIEQKCDSTTDVQVGDVHDFFNTIYEYLKKRENMLIESITSTTKANKEKLKSQQKEMKTIKDNLSFAVEFVEKVVQDKNDIYVLSVFHHVTARLKELNSKRLYKPSNLPRSTLDPEFDDLETVLLQGFMRDLHEHRDRKFNSIDLPTLTVGPTTGDDHKKLANPLGLAINKHSEVFVVDRDHNMVKVFDKRGEFLRYFGGHGHRDGQFNMPFGIAVHPQDGNVYVADRNNNRVQIFSRMGKFIRKIAGGSTDMPFQEPRGIAVDKDGRIYVTEYAAHRLQVLSPEGDLLFTVGSEGTGQGHFKSPTGVAVDSNGRILVVDTVARVQIFDKEGNFVSQFGQKGEQDGEFQGPWNVVTDKKDRIFVVEGINHRVQIFDAEANHICTFGSRGKSKGTFDTPYGLAVDPKGRIWVSDQSNHRLQVF